ncbi:BlaI/MecI/CopY family transcriptional regulator [Acidipila sp. EB88]|uniref:BlaI/MecI/CopY family transcriptional regulator n=1 Tax=Acidipila sp. EB88 TaxID=2305226 RepID=UPI000F5F33E2|nr:BlaI/MecI/CopY family transcriptional regulator [Acidipila sp. EB88]RRA48273.1 BlaI/MecI/CopY family transcriptional regulator [Acidipila sp. EB88]
MAKQEKSALTPLELRVMQAIWRRGPGTVGEVQEELGGALAYTTVQTMLNILERKQKLTRALAGRSYVYTATVTEARASGHAVRDLIDRMFGGSPEELVMSLVHNREIDPDRLAALAERLEILPAPDALAEPDKKKKERKDKKDRKDKKHRNKEGA